MSQSTNHIMMIKPTGFGFNAQTAKNNHFQFSDNSLDKNNIVAKAIQEFDSFVEILRQKNINVIVVNDLYYMSTPDAVFPNNWFSTHMDGTVCLYPMYAPNRRKERNDGVFKLLANQYDFEISNIEDFTANENENAFLEGTGSMVIDRINKIVYASISERTNADLLLVVCEKLNYELVSFKSYHTASENSSLIYHTNVMMCVATSFAVVCLESILDISERQLLVDQLNKTNKTIIEISFAQMFSFAGNMLEVKGKEDQVYLVMSSSAFKSLSDSQKLAIEKYAVIIHSSLHTIEKYGGGSARCMMAELFLPRSI